MLVRFGYVAMSMTVKNASPSKTMTLTNFNKIADREAAIRKLERIGEENIHNTLRLLRHNRAHDIKLYRISSKLIPLIGHESLAGWDPIAALADSFRELGNYAIEHGMRLSFHPDHFTVLSTPRKEVLRTSMADLERHTRMLEAMGLDERSMLNIHIGGTYGNKDKAYDRFLEQFTLLENRIQRRITLENDDKTFTAAETLSACEKLGVPMVLDLHHHMVNNAGEEAVELWPSILKTWEHTGLPPKIHISTPKNEKDLRAHAEYVELGSLLPFLQQIQPYTEQIDVMIEAKMKDEALFRLMRDISGVSGIRSVDQASVEI